MTVNSSLHVPSLIVGLTYTKGSWWIVTIWQGEGRAPAWTTRPQLPGALDLSAQTPLKPLQIHSVPPLAAAPFWSLILPGH